MATLRQDIIDTAARDAVVGDWAHSVTTVSLNDWLCTSGAAACVARDHDMTRSEMLDAIDDLDFTRLVSAVRTAAAKEHKRREWLSALRGVK